VFDLAVNKEQRIPNLEYFSPAPDQASTDSVLVSHGQEYHTSYWGHLGLLGLNDHYLIPRLFRLREHGGCQSLSDQCGDC
jgi:TolB protein